jgi:dihydrofolate reductase
MNIVLTSAENVDDIIQAGGHVCRSLEEAFSFLKGQEQIENIFVIGGERLYTEALEHPECSSIYVTVIESENNYECDAFFPIQQLERRGDNTSHWNNFTMVSFTLGFRYKGICYEFRRYERTQEMC